MPIAARTSQLAELLHRFLALEPEKMFAAKPPVSDYDGPSVDEVTTHLTYLRSTFAPLLAGGQIANLTFNGTSTLQGQLQNVFNTYEQFVRSRDQGSYQNFASNLDSLVFHTQMYGIPYSAGGGSHLEATKAALQVELERAKINNTEVDTLKEQVHNLITPAVAGSLSQSFTARRNTLLYGRIAWLVACVGLGWYATTTTIDLVNTIAASLTNIRSAPQSLDAAAIATIFLRTLILIPLFAAFGFAFSQYSKEREYEEEYAHKAAVAHSLPNYGDLAKDANVRDQIVTAATNVIFVSPGEQARRAERSGVLVSGLKETVEALTKAVGRK